MSDIYEYYQQNPITVFKGLIAKDIAEILLCINTDNSAEVERWIMIAIKADEQNGMKWQLACDYALYADFFRRKFDNKKAQEYSNKAITIFRECGSDGWAKKTEKACP